MRLSWLAYLKVIVYTCRCPRTRMAISGCCPKLMVSARNLNPNKTFSRKNRPSHFPMVRWSRFHRTVSKAAHAGKEERDKAVRNQPDNKFTSLQRIMKERIFANLYIAIDAVIANKVRSLLTALGIIFGVAAVIAMLAIGNGAQQEILEQIKLVGVNNIVVKPIVEQEEEKVE